MKDAGVSDTIWTKTNGLSLTPFLNDRLAKCGLDMIGISVQHVNPDGYKQIADVRIDYDKFVANIADLYNRREGMKVYIKIADSGLSEADKRKFYDDFSPIADYVAVEQLHGWAASDAKDFTLGTNPTTFEGAPLVDKIVCPLPFYMLGINWNGTVSLCNEDWRHETIVGDLNSQTIREVWKGDALKQMRLMHLEGRRGENSMCRNCNYLRTLIDNLDSKRKELARRIA
jgi:radical SAM protein with 4Fe4S-binding SPASM domain